MEYKVHIATSREIGERCKEKAPFPLHSMDECNVFISILYDKLLTKPFIDSKVRCFNFHPGLLPEYRGAGAFSWVILNEEKETGITLHEIDKDIDHGPIIQRRTFPIGPNETAEDLYKKGEKLILEMFDVWALTLGTHPQNIATLPQDETKAHIYYRRDLEHVKNVDRFKRAFTFTGKESAYYHKNGEKIYL